MRKERGWATPWRSDILALMRRGAEAERRRESCPATHCKTTAGNKEQVIGEISPDEQLKRNTWYIMKKGCCLVYYTHYILCIYKYLY